jgi:calpain-15
MATVTKEIAKGIFLHKRQERVQHDQTGIEMIYIFTVQVDTLQILDFSADFTGSENLYLDGVLSSNLVANKTIQPGDNETVAVLKLHKEWKLKSKFKFTMRNPPLDVQREKLFPEIKNLNNMIEVADKRLNRFPYEIMSTEALENQVKNLKFKFIDVEFLPSDVSVYNQESDHPFDVLIHWRRPEDFMSVEYSQGLLEPSIFYESIEPNDIRQGALGNPWLTSALATLAERPALVERLFITKEVNQYGIYKIKICKNGEWTTVTIDDHFP